MRRTELLLGERAGRLDWWRSAACRTADPEMFFPVSTVGPGQDEVTRAKEVCAACLVRRQCLQFALATRQAHGVWGGTTEEERRLGAPRAGHEGRRAQEDAAGGGPPGQAAAVTGALPRTPALPAARDGPRAPGPGWGRSPGRRGR
jgi:WhiB family redox-sensing transcriptional regulator